MEGLVERGKTILLVEDDQFVRALTGDVLKDAGHAVLSAGDGATAIELAIRHPGPIDLFVTDVALAGKSGPDLAKEVRRLRPGIRVLFMSGYSRAGLAVKGITSDDSFLSKPFTPDELSKVVATLLGA